MLQFLPSPSVGALAAVDRSHRRQEHLCRALRDRREQLDFVLEAAQWEDDYVAHVVEVHEGLFRYSAIEFIAILSRARWGSEIQSRGLRDLRVRRDNR